MDLLHPVTLYRPNVGLCLTDGAGHILCGARRFITYKPDADGWWQMPQGGIDADEDLLTAAHRELWEETGLTAEQVNHLATYPTWLTYDWPRDVVAPDETRKGQQQRWLLFHYAGPLPDADTTQDKEFSSFDWLTPEKLLEACVDFRLPIYTQVLAEFKDYLLCSQASSARKK